MPDMQASRHAGRQVGRQAGRQAGRYAERDLSTMSCLQFEPVTLFARWRHNYHAAKRNIQRNVIDKIQVRVPLRVTDFGYLHVEDVWDKAVVENHREVGLDRYEFAKHVAHSHVNTNLSQRYFHRMM